MYTHKYILFAVFTDGIMYTTLLSGFNVLDFLPKKETIFRASSKIPPDKKNYLTDRKRKKSFAHIYMCKYCKFCFF